MWMFLPTEEILKQYCVSDVYPADSSPAAQVTGCNLSTESFRRLCTLKNTGWRGAKGCYYGFGVASGLLQCNDLVAIENTINPERDKNALNFELEQLMANILLIIIRSDSSRFGSLLIFLEFCSK
jgi:hypothetical protein